MINKRIWVIILAILIFINSMLCVFVLRLSKVDRTQGAVELESAIIKAYTSSYQYSPQTLISILNDYRKIQVLIKEYDVFFFIPKSYCDACLSYQLLLIDEYISSNHKTFCVIAPEAVKRKVLSLLGKNVSLEVVTYDPEIVTIDDPLYNESLAFFQVSDHSICNLFIVNKYYGDATLIYFNSILTLTH